MSSQKNLRIFWYRHPIGSGRAGRSECNVAPSIAGSVNLGSDAPYLQPPPASAQRSSPDAVLSLQGAEPYGARADNGFAPLNHPPISETPVW